MKNSDTATYSAQVRNDLAELAKALPDPQTTIFAYDPITVHEKIAYLAGQIPKHNGSLAYYGIVGEDIDLEDAKKAARICVEQALAWFHQSAGGLDNLERILRLRCFIAHSDGFENISEIADAASKFLIESLGAIGRHSRSVIGVKSLPRNAPVLVEITTVLRQQIG